MKYENRTVYRNTEIKTIVFIFYPVQSYPSYFLWIFLWKTPDRKGMGKGAEWHNTQFCDLKSTRATRQDRWKPITNDRKEQYASNPDIDTSRSKYNFHIVKPEGRYYHFIQNRIEQAGCRTRKDSTRFVDTLITASPEFFKRSPQRRYRNFSRGRLIS